MKTILCVDDSESRRFLLSEELSEEGYKVVTASSNEEVLSKFRLTASAKLKTAGVKGTVVSEKTA